MKKLIICLFTVVAVYNGHAQTYTPTPENLEARKQFSDAKFGLFIHWGVFSILGDAEWVMQNENIKENKSYDPCKVFFCCIFFDHPGRV